MQIRLTFNPEINKYAIHFVSAFVIILLLDGVWFKKTQEIYFRVIDHTQVNIYWGLVAWVAIAAALSFLDVSSSASEAAFYGAFIGGSSYLVFNGTELAINPKWRDPQIALMDVLWGISMCTLTSVASHQIVTKM